MNQLVSPYEQAARVRKATELADGFDQLCELIGLDDRQMRVAIAEVADWDRIAVDLGHRRPSPATRRMIIEALRLRAITAGMAPDVHLRYAAEGLGEGEPGEGP